MNYSLNPASSKTDEGGKNTLPANVLILLHSFIHSKTKCSSFTLYNPQIVSTYSLGCFSDMFFCLFCFLSAAELLPSIEKVFNKVLIVTPTESK